MTVLEFRGWRRCRNCGRWHERRRRKRWCQACGIYRPTASVPALSLPPRDLRVRVARWSVAAASISALVTAICIWAELNGFAVSGAVLAVAIVANLLAACAFAAAREHMSEVPLSSIVWWHRFKDDSVDIVSHEQRILLSSDLEDVREHAGDCSDDLRQLEVKLAERRFRRWRDDLLPLSTLEISGLDPTECRVVRSWIDTVVRQGQPFVATYPETVQQRAQALIHGLQQLRDRIVMHSGMQMIEESCGGMVADDDPDLWREVLLTDL